MASKYGSPSGVFLVDGYNLLANKIQTLRRKVVALTEKSDGIGDSWEAHCPTGKRRGELAQDGAFFDTNTHAIHEMLADPGATPAGSLSVSTNGTPVVALAGFAGNTIGSEITGYSGVLKMSYEVLAANDALNKANAEYAVTGIVEDGHIVHALGAETGASGNTEATSVDGAAQTTAGGSGYLAVNALTLGGYTNVVMKIRDSADDAVFGDLITFTAVTAAPTAERVTVAGTVERYVASSYAFTGAGSAQSVTYLAAFVRN
jgi:hypothetical protein